MNERTNEWTNERTNEMCLKTQAQGKEKYAPCKGSDRENDKRRSYWGDLPGARRGPTDYLLLDHACISCSSPPKKRRPDYKAIAHPGCWWGSLLSPARRGFPREIQLRTPANRPRRLDWLLCPNRTNLLIVRYRFCRRRQHRQSQESQRKRPGQFPSDGQWMGQLLRQSTQISVHKQCSIQQAPQICRKVGRGTRSFKGSEDVSRDQDRRNTSWVAVMIWYSYVLTLLTLRSRSFSEKEILKINLRLFLLALFCNVSLYLVTSEWVKERLLGHRRQRQACRLFILRNRAVVLWYLH